MNELLAGDLSDADLANYARYISDKLLENETLEKQAATNSESLFALGGLSAALVDTILSGLDSYRSMAEQVLTNDKTRKGFERMVLEIVYKEFQRRSDESGILP